MGSCREYTTVEEIRDEFGQDVVSVSDSALLRRADRVIDLLEQQLGHTFGRAFLVRSTGNDTVGVTGTGVLIGGDTYLFADYPTLGALADAINGAGKTYAVYLRSDCNPHTPSALLNPMTAEACGPTYDKRVALCVSAMYLQLSGEGSSHIFLPLKLSSVVSVYENGVLQAADTYYAIPGDSWIVRRSDGCLDDFSGGSRWSNRYPGNIEVTYVPQLWLGGAIPLALSDIILSAMRSVQGLQPFESETFGEYSYRRPSLSPHEITDIIGGQQIRPFAVKWMP
jgi:hypothetical protein